MVIRYGTNFSDYIYGTDEDDSLYGYAQSAPEKDIGGDVISGYGGDDLIEGGWGNDTLYGGDGNDRLKGGEGNDSLYADRGTADRVDGGNGYDTASFDRQSDHIGFSLNATDGISVVAVELLQVFGGSGADKVTGGNEEDRFNGNGGNDILVGGGGDDDLYGGSGADTLTGGAGNDYLSAGSGPGDKVNGGGGYDIAAFDWSGSTVDAVLDATDGVTVIGIEGLRVSAGSGNDLVIGGNGADSISGGSGNDILMGGAGNDTLYGGDGGDMLSGGVGDDRLYADAGPGDRVDGGEGFDTASFNWSAHAGGVTLDASDGVTIVSIESLLVIGGSGNDRITGVDGADQLNGGRGNDSLSGGAGSDSLYGDDGNDTLRGGSGDDYLFAGNGLADRLNGGDGFDIAVFERSSQTAGFTLDATDGVTAVNVEELTVYGGIGGDRITGSSGDDHLYGGGGDDLLSGGGGDDYLDAGNGFGDRVIGGEGFDTAVFSRYNQTASFTLDVTDGVTILGIEELEVYGGSGGDKLIGADEIDYFSGGAGDDLLIGAGGNDDLSGGDGNDVLRGGAGDDYLAAGNGLDDLVDGGAGFDVAAFHRWGQTVGFTLDVTDGEAIRDIEELYVYGGWGNDRVIGGDEIDFLSGEAGNDILSGGGGDDELSGGSGDDLLTGGAGDDKLYAGGGMGDRVNGGAGFDTASFSRWDQTSGFTLDATDGVTILGIEMLKVTGGSGNDTLIGGGEVDSFYGGAGDDVLSGGGGDDILDAGDGANDRVDGGAGVDTAIFSWWNRTTAVNFNAGVNAPFTGIEILQISVGSGNDALTGGAEADYFYGGAGNDRLYGGAGDDYLDAGTGMSDRVNGGSGRDTAVFSRWNDTNGFTLDATDGTTVVGIEVLEVRGGSGDDALTGGAEADTFYGDDGDDVLIGGAGDDWLDVGFGFNDRADGGDGNDTAVVNWDEQLVALVLDVSSVTPFTGIETLIVQGTWLNDTITGGAEVDRFDGGNGDDVLRGGGGDDYLDSGNGDRDRISGGTGYDTAVFDRRGDDEGFTLDATDGTTIRGIERLEVYGGIGDDTIIGGEEVDLIDGDYGDDILTGGGGNDTFVFHRGAADGDIVLDFDGNGAADGDAIQLVGFGTVADGASFVQISATQWRVTSASGRQEIITFSNQASIDISDVSFVVPPPSDVDALLLA